MDMLLLRGIVQVLVFLLGLSLVTSTVVSAMRTFVLPRPSGVTMSRAIAWAVRGVYEVVAKPTKSGTVSSLEMFDAAGDTIALVFRKRDDRDLAEDPAWRARLDGLSGVA